MNKALSLFLILVSSYGSISYGQSKGDYEYGKEFLWGINKATNSGLIGGFMLKFSRQLDDNRYHGIAFDIVNIKHPQEQKVYSPYGNTYIIGKEHYLYNIRVNYDHSIVLFRKAEQQGVQINFISQAGLSIGLEAPYYVEVVRTGEGGRTEKVPYDPDLLNTSQIIGTGGVLQGITESNIVPGANIKAALSFEFGTFRSNVVGVETGFVVDAFTREIDIIPTASNRAIFPAAYITLFYGSRK